MTHRFPLDVRFGDLDPAGIVYYPRYLHFCHVGMEEFFRSAVGVPYPVVLANYAIGFPAVRTEVEHRRPIRYGEPVELEVEVLRVGNSSVEWRDRFWHAGEARPSTEATIVTVCVEMANFTKTPVPAWLRAKLTL